MLRFWYWICFLFLLNNFNILIDESYEVAYKIINQSEPIQYLSCINLNEILINKTKINLNEIKNDIRYSLKSLLINKEDYNQSIFSVNIENILNQIKSKNCLIYQNRICFVFIDLSYFLIFRYDSYILSQNLPIKFTEFAFINETFNFLKLIHPTSKFNRITIEHKEYPYSDCTKDYSNFKCLNDKIKQIQRLSKYYYDSNDNESIEINYQINQTIIDNEIKIINQCKQIDCKINLLYPKDGDFKSKSESIMLKSYLCISKFDFYLQLIGLIVLFLNISIYELIIKIINSIDLKFSKFIKLKFIKLKFIKLKLKNFKKISIILITVIFLLILFSRTIFSFIDERDYSSVKSISINSIKSELSIAICVQIDMIKGENYSIYTRSLLELENDTNNALNIIIKDIYLEFLNEKIPTKRQLESKLITFKKFSKCLSRCFQLRIFSNVPKYHSIFSITKLIIEFNKYKTGTIFILTDNELFNSNSYYHSLYYNFRKRIFEKSKLNRIRKYKDYNLVDDNCISKWDCIDQCTNREIYNQIKNQTFALNIVINRKYFTDKEWSNLFIIQDSFKISQKIRKECEVKYSEFDSYIDVKFEKHNRIRFKPNGDINRVLIDLNYDVIYYKEDEVSIFKLLLDLLNIQGNLFGLNFFTFSFMILNLFKLNLKLSKIFKLLIYLICLFGFIYHLWSIYNEIINIEIIFSEHYELINSIQMPVLIFCFDLNRTKHINSNYKLTYDYLDKVLSNELIEDQIFSKIEYLNAANKWIKLDNKTNFQDNNLEIRIFYYLERKCFKLIQNIDYNKNQFNFHDKMNSDDGLIIKIFFNRIYLDNKFFYFFTKTKNEFQFSKIHQLNLLERFESFKSFRIKHEIMERDEFELIRNPLLSDDQNDDLNQFFLKLINYFEKKINLITFKLPFEKTDSNSRKELDDNLFIQLYAQHQEQEHTNHLRKHSNNYLNTDLYNNLEPDLKFSLSFYKKVIAVSNKISLIKLIINLLNVLSFWFNLGILDLHYFLSKIKLLVIILFIQFYKLLIKIKDKLLLILILNQIKSNILD